MTSSRCAGRARERKWVGGWVGGWVGEPGGSGERARARAREWGAAPGAPLSPRTHVQRVGARVVHHGPHVDHIVELFYRLRRLLLGGVPNHHRHAAEALQVGGRHREALNVEAARAQQARHLVQHARLVVHKNGKHHPRVALRPVVLHARENRGHHRLRGLRERGGRCGRGIHTVLVVPANAARGRARKSRANGRAARHAKGRAAH